MKTKSLVQWMEDAAPGSRLVWRDSEASDYWKLDNGKWRTTWTEFEYEPELYFDDSEDDFFERVEA